jgi:hypothetical protein
MIKYKQYYISIIYAFFIVFFIGNYEADDFFNSAKTGDVLNHLQNLDFARVLDFNSAVLLFFPSILWGIFLKTLTIFFENDLFIINIIQFTIAFFICFISYKHSLRKSYIILILFSSLIFDFYIGTLRHGLATVIFLFGFFEKSLIKKVTLYVLAIFTHPVAAWVISIDLISNIILKINSVYRLGRIQINYRILAIISISILYFFIANIFSENSSILSLFGYSGSRYVLNESTGRSFIGFLVWFSITLIIIIKKKFYKEDIFSFIFLSQVCFLYFSFESIYRFLSTGIVIILLNAINKKSLHNNVILGIYLFFTIFHFSIKGLNNWQFF